MKKQQKYRKLQAMHLIGITSLTWKRYLQQKLNEYDITLKQIYLLRHLLINDYLFPAKIAEMLFCDRPTATVIMKNMERKGWIKKEKDPDDGKRIRISISKKGEKKFYSIPESTYQTEKSGFNPMSCFTKKEKEQLEKLMKKLNSHMDQIK